VVTGVSPDAVRDRLRQSTTVHQAVLADEELVAGVVGATNKLVETFRARRKLLCFGNGGSASDAQHIAAEFVSRVLFDRPGLPAIALGANFAVSSAISNDYDFELVFANQIAALGTAGDVALGITTSGNSRNVIAGLKVARDRGLITMAFTGRDGGRLPPVDFLFRVPSTVTPRIQECHILIGHIVSELVEATLFQPGGGSR
jgi:D-sedoheptulose 7-phosphate isomerase